MNETKYKYENKTVAEIFELQKEELEELQKKKIIQITFEEKAIIIKQTKVKLNLEEVTTPKLVA
ncbi:MAG: hypothetical protein MJ149_02190 [Clostridia bacterium]|nr:hypothetical protein [Clostridia bacterium]